MKNRVQKLFIFKDIIISFIIKTRKTECFKLKWGWKQHHSTNNTTQQ